jgi:DMSO reductase anchor subunit
MDRTLTYALLAGVALVILAVIVKAALRWIFKLCAVLLVLAALAVGTWLWFNYSNQQPQPERTPIPTRRATPPQH